MWGRAKFRYEMVYQQARRKRGRQRWVRRSDTEKRIPRWFTERQLAQLTDTTFRLRRLNRKALSLLEHITFWRLSDKQFIDARESLELTVTLMSSALRRRQQLVSSGREQKPSRIRVIIGDMGSDEADPLDDEPADIPEPLRPNRAWNDE